MDGWRGGPVLDPAELGRVIAMVGDALADNPQLAEIEINPLRVTTGGLVALDAVIIAEEATDGRRDQ
jgi:acetyltransferase